MHPQSSIDYAKFAIQHNTYACMSSIFTCKTLYVTAPVNTAHNNSAWRRLCDQSCCFAEDPHACLLCTVIWVQLHNACMIHGSDSSNSGSKQLHAIAQRD